MMAPANGAPSLAACSWHWKACMPGMPNRGAAGRRRTGCTGIDQPTGLACESRKPCKSCRVARLQECRRGDALGFVRAALARQTLGQGFGQQRPALAFVAMV